MPSSFVSAKRLPEKWVKPCPRGAPVTSSSFVVRPRLPLFWRPFVTSCCATRPTCSKGLAKEYSAVAVPWLLCSVGRSPMLPDAALVELGYLARLKKQGHSNQAPRSNRACGFPAHG